ncbi:hypothetical protein JMJ35_007405 [Cladonia borealis]|uniref:Uncharacterized protein n=1 Tax=Cladonia borealis TaxID=184061 RepID=A0AA39U858_9LECA|nr:hypothetical protein JMJ35_007405 [Cladonia borealis]
MRISSILKTEDEANGSGHGQNDANWIKLQQLLLQTDLGGFWCAWKVEKREYHGNDETSNWQIDPNEAHQYWPHFCLRAEGDYAGASYRYASATRTSYGPTNKGQVIRCNTTYHTADFEDQYGNDEGGLEVKVLECITPSCLKTAESQKVRLGVPRDVIKATELVRDLWYRRADDRLASADHGSEM